MKAQRSPEKRHSTVGSGVALPSELPWPIEMLSPAHLKSSLRNARTHSKKQIQHIADSIARFGVINPIVADGRGRIVAGHARREAARLLGLKRVPVIRVSHLNETELRAYTLVDNKLAEKAGWDRELLSVEIEELQVALPEIGLDIGITGFEPGEIDALLADFKDHEPGNTANDIPALQEIAVAKTGDLFVLGAHRLIVADARQEEAYFRLMQSLIATMAFLDPPYNVPIAGHVGGRGRTKHREFVHASGEMSAREFTSFLQCTLSLCARHIIDGGIVYTCMDWRHIGELLAAGKEVFGKPKNICIWVKTTPGQGSFYRSQHELVFVYKRGDAAHINTFELGQHGRTRSNVWVYPGVNSFRAGRMDELKMHPTVKPVALVADAMRDCSRRGSIVLDAFAGSGTTIIAAEQLGRRAYCIEVDPSYVDVAIRRWQRITGKDAVLETTKQTFDELAALNESGQGRRTTRTNRGSR